ncbi:RING-H2 finger protein ATL13 [Aegilops tauschii subsp. strangulata]|nr:RING-H2 finger protein ATL13 [Aegilops tauschii subsp. strangulata]
MHAAISYAALSPLQLPLPYLPPPLPPLLPLLSPPPPAAVDAGFQSRISPKILLIVLILAVIFFVSGLLHLLVWLLFRPTPRDPGDAGSSAANATAFHGQLQQLFHLHDAGVDQSFIDALPVFLYGAVVGAGGKDPFDCAVCLCEFADDDRLRLLPKCSHAFHVECIDTWLLSHSTCPLCRCSLLADFSPCGGGCSSLVFVLESGSEGSVSGRVDRPPAAHLSLVMEQEEGCESQTHSDVKEKDEVVVPVKLGKFRSQATEGGAGCSSNPDQDVRRCYSMGTYEYVMDQSSLLRVSVKPPAARLSKPTMDKKESFSISKIWMRGGLRRKDSSAAPSGSSSRRASSFRLPSALQRAASDIGAPKRRADVVSPVTESEYNVSAWDKSGSGSVVDWDVESCTAAGGLRSRADEAPSFARRTLLWIRGHQ